MKLREIAVPARFQISYIDYIGENNSLNISLLMAEYALFFWTLSLLIDKNL